eukprot:SAG22_NODE_10051_length_556_cov_0.452954_1_plen_154_part_10
MKKQRTLATIRCSRKSDTCVVPTLPWCRGFQLRACVNTMSRFALATVVLSYLSVCRGAPAAPLASELARETDAEHRAERKAVTEGGRGGKSGGAAACSLQADCAIAQYCDDTHSCYECSVLNHTKVKCDALDGDCCSAAFLQNCPSNPKGCAPP